jgi:hypothetical protein
MKTGKPRVLTVNGTTDYGVPSHARVGDFKL